MTREELLELARGEYCGGGYFRARGYPKGRPAPVIHAPELVKQLLEEIVRLESRGTYTSRAYRPGFPTEEELREALGNKGQTLNYLLQANFAELEKRALAIDFAKYNELFKSGRDVYRAMAAELFGVPENQVSEAMRRMAKSISYGKVYSDDKR